MPKPFRTIPRLVVLTGEEMQVVYDLVGDAYEAGLRADPVMRRILEKLGEKLGKDMVWANPTGYPPQGS